MMAEQTFTTWTGLEGTWPTAPKYWSFSSLAEASLCPRRYALRHARYTSLWSGSGYPALIAEAAIVGTAIHEGMETTLRAIREAGCVSFADEEAIDTLRGLGGYTAIATAATQKILSSLENNPRMRPRLRRLADRLERRTPEMRWAIQTFISRISMIRNNGRQGSVRQGSLPGDRAPIGAGVHAEVSLVAERERLKGRIDLLTRQGDDIAILDFKTGEATTHDVEQVTFYGLLWMLDGAANPNQLPVNTLTIAYIDHHQPVPTPEDWNAVRQRVARKIEQAEHALSSTPPSAVPSVECRHCSVRQICDEYWQSEHAKKDPASPFADIEVVVRGLNGETSWFVEAEEGSGAALLRATTHDARFALGQRLRILGAAMGENEDEGCHIVTINSNSEVFTAVSARSDRP